MAGETTEEIVVKIEPELPLGDGGDKVVVTQGDGKTAVDPAVAELAQQYKDLEARAERDRKAREDADRRAEHAAREVAQARQEVETVRTEAVDDRMAAITTGMAAAEAEASAAETEYKTAMESGDFTAAAKAQRKMAAAEAKTLRLTEAKDDLETQRKAPKTTEGRVERPQPAQAAPSDPVEAYAQQLTPKSREWVLAHRDYVTDTRKNAKMVAAHHDAVSEGLQPDTQEYFDHIETFVGLRQPTNQNGNGAQAATKPRRTSVPVAPVVSSAGGTSGNGNEVRLSAREAAAATDGTHTWNYDDPSGQKRFKKGDPIGVQEFARRKKAMQDSGQYDRVFLEQ